MLILALIVVNGVLIGVQTYDTCPPSIEYIQLTILLIFAGEVFLRWKGRLSTEAYFADRWNIFDIFIVAIGIIPEVAGILFPNMSETENGIFATLRVLRIVQLTRSIRAIEELRVLIGVLLKSIKSLSYIAVLFLLIMYIYAIVGVTLFKNKNYDNSEHLELTISNPDPYGDIWEAFFTLFRILTGEDWTDLRYNLLDNKYTTANGDSVPGQSNFTVTFYHVSWMVIAAYLLVNLVVGAIVNNFQLVLDAKREEEEQFKKLREKQLRAERGEDDTDVDDGDDDNDDDDTPPKRKITKRPKV
jgi:voltage-gated sodium channel